MSAAGELTFGLLLLLFSGDFIYDLYHPEQLDGAFLSFGRGRDDHC